LNKIWKKILPKKKLNVHIFNNQKFSLSAFSSEWFLDTVFIFIVTY
jgi:hypothetical protein